VLILASAFGCINYFNNRVLVAAQDDRVPDDLLKTIKSAFFPYTTSSQLEPAEFAGHVSDSSEPSALNEQGPHRAHEATPPPDGFDVVVASISPNEHTIFLGQSLLPNTIDSDTFYGPSWCFSPTVNNRNVRVDRSWKPDITAGMMSYGIIGCLLGLSDTSQDPSLVFPEYSVWPYTVVSSKHKEKDNKTSETNKDLVLPLFRHLRHLHQPDINEILTCEHVTAKQAKLLAKLLSRVSKTLVVLFSKFITINCQFLIEQFQSPMTGRVFT